MGMKIALKTTPKSCLIIFWIGIAVGCICRLADYFPAETVWGFSSIQTLLGFWIITNTTIVLLSSSCLCAGLSSFLYMFGMTLSFYGSKAILGNFIPLFSGEFNTGLFVMFTIAAIPCAIAAAILYLWNQDRIFNSVLYALPVGALLAEAFATTIFLFAFHRYLFQVFMDLVGAVGFAIVFWKKVKSRKVYIFSIGMTFAVFYFLMWHKELMFWLQNPELLA